MTQTLLNFFYRYFLFIKNKNIILKGKLKVKNKPIIHVLDGSSLIIGNNVTLNSKNKKYHVNMFAPCNLAEHHTTRGAATHNLRSEFLSVDSRTTFGIHIHVL